MDELTTQLRETVSQLFAEDKIDLFIGQEKGSLPLTRTPCFIRSKDEVERLVWDSFCSNNLAVYLPRYFVRDPRDKEQEFPRIGIMVKGCDGRNLAILLNERQILRSNITVVGIACNATVDRDKVLDELEGREIVDVREDALRILVVDRTGGESELDRASLLADPCLVCADPVPSVADILLGERPDLEKREDDLVKAFEAEEIEERRKYFEEEMAKCIRCYACRQVCPLCYCKECFADQTYPKWMGTGNALSEVILFHIGRMLHTVGRCVDCGACAQACPMGVDLRRFQKKLVEIVGDRFGYTPGCSLEDVAPLATFHPEDRQEFITEPR